MYWSLSIILALTGPLSADMEVMDNIFHNLFRIQLKQEFSMNIAYKSAPSDTLTVVSDIIIYTTDGPGKIKIVSLNEVSIQLLSGTRGNLSSS